MSQFKMSKWMLVCSLILVVVFVAGCQRDQHETSGIIGTEGGTLEVNSNSSPINGARVVIPPDSFVENTEIGLDPAEATVEIPQQLLYGGSGVAVSLVNEDSFSFAEVYVPYDPAERPTDATPLVGVFDESDGSWSIAPVISVDEQLHLIHVVTTSLSQKQFYPIWILPDGSKGWIPAIETGFDVERDHFPCLISNETTCIANISGDWCDPSGNTEYNDPLGYCHGVCAYTLWYFNQYRNQFGPLAEYTGYEGNHVPNGIAAISQQRVHDVWYSLECLLFLSSTNVSSSVLKGALLLTGKPLKLRMNKDWSADGGHCILVCSYDGEGSFNVFDPNTGDAVQFLQTSGASIQPYTSDGNKYSIFILMPITGLTRQFQDIHEQVPRSVPSVSLSVIGVTGRQVSIQCDAHDTTTDLLPATPLQYLIYWGEQYEAASYTSTPPTQHTYSAPGTYTIRLRVMDSDWMWVEATAQVTIGGATVAVPNVVGMTESAAGTALTGAGLSVGTISRQYSATPFGQVISQNPQAETNVAPGASVSLTVSCGSQGDETILLPGDVPLEMMWIPAGSFMMGRYADEVGGLDKELPQHLVTLSSGFWMGKYELTKAQWTAVMGTTPWSIGESYVLDDPNSPAVYVSWNDVQAFITTLNAANPGLTFRLPSEAEWEYACRAGTTTWYYWGDDPTYSSIGDFSWWWPPEEHYAHVVGLKLPNAFGLYDMSGNAWEYCQDWTHDNYVGAPADGSAWESPVGSYRVIRGGSWNWSDPTFHRSAGRNVSAKPEGPGGSEDGFRIVLNP